jgi:glyoxylase-like metal-dependent hydrolase (beta-lactamase superfamily II)
MTQLTTVKAGDLLLKPGEQPLSVGLAERISAGATGASTVTHLTDGRTQVIVDTGFGLESNMSPAWKTRNLKALESVLAGKGIWPDRIDCVFITHWHRDHFGNLTLFRNARILTEEQAYDTRFKDGRFCNYLRAIEKIDVGRIEPVRSGDEIVDGVRVVSTPGHTIDHASLLVTTEIGVVAVAGDAVLDEAGYRQRAVWNHNPDFFSAEAVLETYRMLGETASAIVPGHGQLFSLSTGS